MGFVCVCGFGCSMDLDFRLVLLHLWFLLVIWGSLCFRLIGSSELYLSCFTDCFILVDVAFVLGLLGSVVSGVFWVGLCVNWF